MSKETIDLSQIKPNTLRSAARQWEGSGKGYSVKFYNDTSCRFNYIQNFRASFVVTIGPSDPTWDTNDRPSIQMFLASRKDIPRRHNNRGGNELRRIRTLSKIESPESFRAFMSQRGFSELDTLCGLYSRLIMLLDEVPDPSNMVTGYDRGLEESLFRIDDLLVGKLMKV
jgi:hypothetical protein